MERARAFRLDAPPHAAGPPARHAADKAAAAHRDEDGVEGGSILLPFEGRRALADHGALDAKGWTRSAPLSST